MKLILFLFILFAQLSLFSQSRTALTYVVKEKNTLYSIAQEFDISVADLRSWNLIGSGGIVVGQELIVGYQEVILNEDSENSGEQISAINNLSDSIIQVDSLLVGALDTVIAAPVVVLPKLDSCIIGKWESRLPCDVYFARAHFFEFTLEESGRYGIVVCANPYPQYIYQFNFETVDGDIELSDQLKVYGGADDSAKKPTTLHYECALNILLVEGIKYDKK